MSKGADCWPHAPSHRLSTRGTYFVTAGTYRKAHHFRGAARLAVLQRGLLKLAQDLGWQLEAWAIFSNHYHFVGHSPSDDLTAETLSSLVNQLHQETALWVNRLDQTLGQKVWFNYWETRLTYQHSYLARLRYVHQNAVKHGLVPAANQYPWCSARWFEHVASPAQVETIYRMKIDLLKVFDEFEPDGNW